MCDVCGRENEEKGPKKDKMKKMNTTPQELKQLNNGEKVKKNPMQRKEEKERIVINAEFDAVVTALDHRVTQHQKNEHGKNVSEKNSRIIIYLRIRMYFLQAYLSLELCDC